MFAFLGHSNVRFFSFLNVLAKSRGIEIWCV